MTITWCQLPPTHHIALIDTFSGWNLQITKHFYGGHINNIRGREDCAPSQDGPIRTLDYVCPGSQEQESVHTYTHKHTHKEKVRDQKCCVCVVEVYDICTVWCLVSVCLTVCNTAINATTAFHISALFSNSLHAAGVSPCYQLTDDLDDSVQVFCRYQTEVSINNVLEALRI